jgi:transcriptional regulator with XRE-family HTH domain
VAKEDWSAEQAKTVGAEIKRLRGGQSGQWLSDRTFELGYRVARTTISELENGKRKYISVSELVVLAQALETAPVVLLYPAPYDENVEYAPRVMMSKFNAAQAFSGIFDPETDTVAADYWLNTSRLRSAREVHDRRNGTRNMLEIATRLGDVELAKRMAEKLADEQWTMQPPAGMVRNFRRDLESVDAPVNDAERFTMKPPVTNVTPEPAPADDGG